MDRSAPVRPDAADCCGNGCRRCVFDTYEEEMKIWEKQQKGQNVKVPDTQCLLNPDSYVELVIVKIQKLNSCTYMYTMVDVNSESSSTQALCNLELGQHVIIMVETNEMEWTSRPYTPVSTEQEEMNGICKIAIKLYDEGKMSRVIRQWQVRSVINCRGPVGIKLNYTTNQWENLILLSAGTGITPLLRIIRAILSNENEETDVTLCYACQKYEYILFKSELDAFTDYWNFHVSYFLSSELKQDVDRKKKYQEVVFCKKIDQDFLMQKLEIINKEKSYVIVCGTSKFSVDMRNFLIKCKFDENNIYIL